MNEKLPSGEACREAKREKNTRAAYRNTKANQQARAQYVLDGEMCADELVEHHRQLRRDFYARNPHLGEVA